MKSSIRWTALAAVVAFANFASSAKAVPPGNTHLGTGALSHNTGTYNTVVGDGAMDPVSWCTGRGTPYACCTGRPGVGSCGNSGTDNTAVGSGALKSNTSGTNNTAEGSGALEFNTMGSNNTAVGYSALLGNYTGSQNTAVGSAAMGFSMGGESNTALGDSALLSNNGSDNTAVGAQALQGNTTGSGNTAMGFLALNSFNGYDGTGSDNTAVGAHALQYNILAADNTAVGFEALTSPNGSDNTAVGFEAMNPNYQCTGPGVNAAGNLSCCTGVGTGNCVGSGTENVAVGNSALEDNLTGTRNTAVGVDALAKESGSNNTAIGGEALTSDLNDNENVAVGDNALTQLAGTGDGTAGAYNTGVGTTSLYNLTSGQYNTAVGRYAGINLSSGSNNIYISNAGANEFATIRIGTPGTQSGTFIAGISGATSSSGVPVYVNNSGQLGVATSSARFKDDIQDMGDSTSALLKLRPVRFRYKKDIDPSGLEQYGLVAEEVAKVYPDLVVYDDKGQPQAVRYHFINAMLLNEVQKQARTQETLATKLEQQQRVLDRQVQSIDALQRQNADELLRNAALQERLDRIERSVQAAAGQGHAVARAAADGMSN